MHIRSLERFDFDSVLLPYSFQGMQNPRYAEDFNRLLEICRMRNVVLQTIKSVARRPWGERLKTHNTFFYEPLVDQAAIDKAVHWALGLSDGFVITPGDVEVLPKMLSAAIRYQTRPTETEMQALINANDIHPVFPY